MADKPKKLKIKPITVVDDKLEGMNPEKYVDRFGRHLRDEVYTQPRQINPAQAYKSGGLKGWDDARALKADWDERVRKGISRARPGPWAHDQILSDPEMEGEIETERIARKQGILRGAGGEATDVISSQEKRLNHRRLLRAINGIPTPERETPMKVKLKPKAQDKAKSKIAQSEMTDKPRQTIAEELAPNDPKLRADIEEGQLKASEAVRKRAEVDRRQISSTPPEGSPERRKANRRQGIEEIKRLKGELAKGEAPPSPGARDTLVRNVPKIKARIEETQRSLVERAREDRREVSREGSTDRRYLNSYKRPNQPIAEEQPKSTLNIRPTRTITYPDGSTKVVKGNRELIYPEQSTGTKLSIKPKANPENASGRGIKAKVGVPILAGLSVLEAGLNAPKGEKEHAVKQAVWDQTKNVAAFEGARVTAKALAPRVAPLLGPAAAVAFAPSQLKYTGDKLGELGYHANELYQANKENKVAEAAMKEKYGTMAAAAKTRKKLTGK